MGQAAAALSYRSSPTRWLPAPPASRWLLLRPAQGQRSGGWPLEHVAWGRLEEVGMKFLGGSWSSANSRSKDRACHVGVQLRAWLIMQPTCRLQQTSYYCAVPVTNQHLLFSFAQQRSENDMQPMGGKSACLVRLQAGASQTARFVFSSALSPPRRLQPAPNRLSYLLLVYTVF
jgi:hypothetical protein